MMTDEEVKKGLECCARASQESWCGICPYHKNKEPLLCTTKMARDALALINRMVEENKELRALCRKKSNGMKLDEWVKMVNEADCGIKLVDTNAIEEQIRKEIAKQILQSFAQFRAVSPN